MSPVRPTSVPEVPVSKEETGQMRDARPSRLEYMLERMAVDEGPMVRRGTQGERMPMTANYIRIKCLNEGVYQYAVSFSPSIDSKFIRNAMINEHSDVLGKVKSFDGAILFLPIKLQEKETILHSMRQTDQSKITIRIKMVKVLPPDACVQLYNIVFRKIMYILKMVQVGRHYYDPHRPANVPQHRLEVWPGYVTAIAQYEGGLMLLTDVSHRVLRTETVYDIICGLHDKLRGRGDIQAAVAKAVIGNTVLTRYNNKTYRIDDISWDQCPKTTFSTKSGEISFKDYYFKQYNKKIQDDDQPLLIHKPTAKDKRMNRGVPDIIALIPELCYMTGLTDEMREDFNVMKDLASHTRITPGQRQVSLRKFCENVANSPEARAELGKWGLELHSDTLKLEGRQLPPEKIIFGNQKSHSAGEQADWGRAATREHVISAVHLQNWLLLFTQRDQQRAMDFWNQMRREAPNMGIQVREPETVVLPNDRTESYLSNIRDRINPNVQLVVTIFPTSRDDRYNAIKKLCCVESPVPSQVIISKTIGKPKSLRSVVQKIVLQINCKLGGELWGVSIPLKTLMVCGIDSFHERGSNSIGGFVASMNQQCTRWYSRVAHQLPGQELMDGLKMCFIAALRKYHEVNHTLPERIVLFRDGVGDGDMRNVSEFEVPQLSEVFPHFGEAYQPKLTVIICQKRINTRLFARQGERLDNPPPGSIMDHTVTRRDKYDFFLVSQHVRQGTVSPTHYVVIHDESGWDPDKVQKLTYKMTHLYYNWPGTVRVPAPCQYAHKLAYQVGQNIRKDPSQHLCDRLFYL